MPKYKRTKPYILNVIHIPIIIIAIAVLGVSMLASTAVVSNIKNDDVLSSSSNKGKGNSDKSDKQTGKPAFTGNYNKPDKTSGQSNSRLYRESITNVVSELTEVAETEASEGNTEVSDLIDEVVAEQEEDVTETTEAINEVENRSKWKTMLFGTDYDNLGKLRSSLAHNTNTIRKLTRTAGSVAGESSDDVIAAQLGTLLQERQRIMDVVYEQETQFTLVGWMLRLMTGYTPEPSDDSLDPGLEDDVEDIITGTEPDGTMDSSTEPGGDTTGTEPGDTVDSSTEPADDTGTTDDTSETTTEPSENL